MENQANMDEVASLQSFIEEISGELAQTESELRENDTLIRQSAAEVERLVRQDEQVTRYVRQMQAQGDEAPADDPRERYEALLSTRQRLFAVRGRLESLQSDQRNLEKLEATYGRLLKKATGEEAAPAATAILEATSVRHPNVARIIQEGESVRHDLADSLQDSLLSPLSNLILQAEICQRLFDGNPERARAELGALKGVAAATFTEVKEALFDVRPLMLDDLGVVPTLRRYAEMLSEKNDAPIEVAVTGEERRLPPYMESILFRATQELLRNAKDHAQATQVQLRVSMTQDEVLIVVEDNGIGLHVDDAEAQVDPDEKDLANLRERIGMIGGALEIQSALGQGTQALLTVPVSVETKAGV